MANKSVEISLFSSPGFQSFVIYGSVIAVHNDVKIRTSVKNKRVYYRGNSVDIPFSDIHSISKKSLWIEAGDSHFEMIVPDEFGAIVGHGVCIVCAGTALGSTHPLLIINRKTGAKYMLPLAKRSIKPVTQYMMDWHIDSILKYLEDQSLENDLNNSAKSIYLDEKRIASSGRNAMLFMLILGTAVTCVGLYYYL